MSGEAGGEHGGGQGADAGVGPQLLQRRADVALVVDQRHRRTTGGLPQRVMAAPGG